MSFKFKLRNKIKKEPNNNTIVLGKKTNIRHCNIYIKGSGNTLIFKDNVNLRDVHIEIDGVNCILEIGENTIIGKNCYLSAREHATKLIIGDNCMFSRNIKIMTSDGHDIYDSLSKNRINLAKDIIIGDRVWLADGVIVLKGVHIGGHSIVGINSIVTTNISKNSIAAGIPAKIIKTNVTWDEKLTY